VSNNGSGALTGVTLTDNVPSIVGNVSYSGDASGTGNNISINIGTLGAGQSKTYTVTGTAKTAGSAVNTVTVDSNETDPRTASARITVVAPDVQITKGVGYSQNGPFNASATIDAGNTAWYQITV